MIATATMSSMIVNPCKTLRGVLRWAALMFAIRFCNQSGMAHVCDMGLRWRVDVFIVWSANAMPRRRLL
jgi:hypothetical protein